MTGIFAAIRHGLRNVARFSGRDRPGRFWPYVIALFAGTTVAGFAIFIPLALSALERVKRFAAAHPDQVTETVGPGQYTITVHGNHPELLPDMSAFFTVVGVSAFLFVLFAAAAVVRRLHDTGRCGWWGLMPIPFLSVGLIAFPMFFVGSMDESSDPDFRLFGLLFLNNVVYLATVISLIALLVQRGTPGPNRYGPEPD